MAVNTSAQSLPGAQAPTAARADVRGGPDRRPFGLRQFSLYAALLGLSAVFCFPFLWLVLTSLKPPDEVFAPGWIPRPVTWSNYTDVFRYAPVGRWLWNTLLVSVLAVVSVIISSSLVAYAFARLRFRGRKQLFSLVIATYMLPAAVTTIPTFLI